MNEHIIFSRNHTEDMPPVADKWIWMATKAKHVYYANLFWSFLLLFSYTSTEKNAKIMLVGGVHTAYREWEA